ncbi:MAG: peroxiredoxin family protein [Fimbriimonas sp.]
MRIASALFVVALLAGCSSSPPEPSSPLVGKVAPAFRLPPVRPAGDISLADYKGKVVLLDFWATWCGPCVKIMPQIGELHKKHADKGLVVIGISTETPTTVAKFKERVLDPGYEMVTDTTSVVNFKYGVTNLPTTVLIGRDGKIRHYEVGADPQEGVATLEKEIEKALAEGA